jgi:hypothetical protein
VKVHGSNAPVFVFFWIHYSPSAILERGLLRLFSLNINSEKTMFFSVFLHSSISAAKKGKKTFEESMQEPYQPDAIHPKKHQQRGGLATILLSAAPLRGQQ